MNDDSNDQASTPTGDSDATRSITPMTPPQDAEVTLVQAAAVSGGAASRLLEDAVVQLRKLGELREQELKRNELLVAEMRDHIRRHTRFSRTLLLLGAVAVGLLAVLGLGVNKLRNDQNQTENEVRSASATLDRLNGTLAEASAQTGTRMEAVAGALAQASAKLGDVEAGLAGKVDSSLQAVRDERDAVRVAVQATLDGHSREMMERELLLREEQARLAQEAELARAERTRIIQDAITKLSAMAEIPPTDAPAEGPAAAAGADAPATGSLPPAPAAAPADAAAPVTAP